MYIDWNTMAWFILFVLFALKVTDWFNRWAAEQYEERKERAVEEQRTAEREYREWIVGIKALPADLEVLEDSQRSVLGHTPLG